MYICIKTWDYSSIHYQLSLYLRLPILRMDFVLMAQSSRLTRWDVHPSGSIYTCVIVIVSPASQLRCAFIYTRQTFYVSEDRTATFHTSATNPRYLCGLIILLLFGWPCTHAWVEVLKPIQQLSSSRMNYMSISPIFYLNHFLLKVSLYAGVNWWETDCR